MDLCGDRLVLYDPWAGYGRVGDRLGSATWSAQMSEVLVQHDRVTDHEMLGMWACGQEGEEPAENTAEVALVCRRRSTYRGWICGIGRAASATGRLVRRGADYHPDLVGDTTGARR